MSFVLNGRAVGQISPLTRQRVIDAATELGYHPHAPARQLAAGRSHTLALVLRQSPEQVASDAVLSETLRGLAAAARSGGFRVMVEPLNLEGTYDALLRSQHADGLIISGPRTDDPGLRELIDEGFPIVLQGSLPGAPVASVDVDNEAAARGAVEHLIALGHRRIGCITNASLAYTAAQDRLAGWRAALQAAGLDAREDLVAYGAFDAPSGHRAMAELLDRGPLDAVFVASDVVALGAFGAIRERGLRAPQDISVVGFDDIALAAYFDPSLTTVRLPALELGQAAGRALLERIADPAATGRTLLPTELIVRGSTGPPLSA